MVPTYLISLALLAGGITSALGSGGDDNSTAFIRRECDVTLYKKVCFTSLVRYAASVQQDQVRLSLVATNVSLSRVQDLAAHVASLRRIFAGGWEAAALRDCGETLRDAADLARRSVGEIGRLDDAKGPEVAWRVSNAQTWMSAVITNEETCADGFHEAPATASGPGSISSDVYGRVKQAQKYASNALALVNQLVAGR